MQGETTLNGTREGAMRTTRVWTAALVVSVVLAGFAQHGHAAFSVLSPAGKPVITARLGDAPHKPGMDAEPSFGE